MRELKIAVAQFEPHDGDKAYNLSVIEKLTSKAKDQGAEVISFHEMSITAYTFTKDLDEHEITQLAEVVPNGSSTQALINISKKYEIPVLAGLVEKENERIYNTYICVNGDGLIAKFRKLHPFINHHQSRFNKFSQFLMIIGKFFVRNFLHSPPLKELYYIFLKLPC